MCGLEQTDLVFTFLKAFYRQMIVLKRMDGIDPRLFQSVAHFLLHGIVKKNLRAKPRQESPIDPTQPSFASSSTLKNLTESDVQSLISTSDPSNAVIELQVVDAECKVRELALKILHKAWRAWFDIVEVGRAKSEGPSIQSHHWQNHGEFRNQLVAIIERITEGYPQNASYQASAIKLQTLAVRYFVRHADSFDGTEEQMNLVAELLRKSVYAD